MATSPTGQYGFELTFHHNSSTLGAAMPSTPTAPAQQVPMQPAPLVRGCMAVGNVPAPSESAQLDIILRELAAETYED